MTMTVTLLNPEIQPAVLDAISGIVRTDLAVQVYLSGSVLYAASATLAVNLGIAVMLIAIPSFLVSFFGVVFAMVFAATYGVTLAPIGHYAAAMIPHSITVLIEFQAYIVAAFRAYLIGRTIFLPVAGENGLSGKDTGLQPRTSSRFTRLSSRSFSWARSTKPLKSSIS